MVRYILYSLWLVFYVLADNHKNYRNTVKNQPASAACFKTFEKNINYALLVYIFFPLCFFLSKFSGSGSSKTLNHIRCFLGVSSGHKIYTCVTKSHLFYHAVSIDLIRETTTRIQSVIPTLRSHSTTCLSHLIASARCQRTLTGDKVTLQPKFRFVCCYNL